MAAVDVASRFSRARETRDGTLERLREASGASGAFVFQVAEIGGKLRLTGSLASGETAAQVMARFASLDSCILDEILALLREPRPASLRTFVEWDRTVPSEFAHRGLMQRIWKSSGAREALLLFVYDGARLAGCVGLLRSGTCFSSTERRALSAISDDVRLAIIAADRVERDVAPLGDDSLVVSDAGDIMLVSPSATAWLGVPAFETRLREAVRALAAARVSTGAMAHGPVWVRFSSMTSADGRTCFLARLQTANALERAEDFVLSPGQREVARLAAAGATIAEIAESLGRGQETVRSHLGAAYRRLGVSTRLELARALAADSSTTTEDGEVTVW